MYSGRTAGCGIVLVIYSGRIGRTVCSGHIGCSGLTSCGVVEVVLVVEVILVV